MEQAFRHINDFVYLFPLFMSFVWMVGALIFFFRHERNNTQPQELEAYPFFSVLIPCHNEAANITDTVSRLLKLDYPDYEIIAIDDGSTDDTGAILKEMSDRHERLRVIFLQQNQGKAAGLSIGALAARGDLLLTIDADALVEPAVLKWMAWHFEKFPRVGAVTGNPRILNRTSLLAKIQTGEFSTIIGLIKRTQRILGKVLTVSGVIAAFRKQALLSVGFWDTDMVTEDIDITWKLEKRFWDIRYEPRAICWILVPETLKGLWRQRFRWAQGGVEVLRKHINIFTDWRQRRLWPVYIESVISLIWAYCFWGLAFLWLVTTVFSLSFPVPLAAPIPPEFTGAILALTCVIQFSVSLIVDRHYEKKMLRYLFWVVWYPFAYWMISSLTVIWAAPRALFKKKGVRAVWISPDRGLEDR
ncbi:MAG: poly-beta-1,6-N-acetyl-D-glucosamine synthase [Pseudomonadota bacterium]